MSDSGTDGITSPDDSSESSGPGEARGGNHAGTRPDLVGTVLAGRYRILQKLGEGGMAEVYLGEHLKIGRRDAIKVLRGPLMQDAEAIARFNRGARNVATVQHPNVCAIYDYSDTDEGIPFLAMEFIAGESLKELLDREGPLPVGRAVRIACQVADALDAAHSAGIVHRDLKPANIMLMRGRGGDDEVRVVDFDIAKGSQEGEESEVTRLGFVIGTPEYMSPEQLMAERLDGRSDVYSLGIVVFRMLTGSLPFQGGSPHELVFQRLTNPPLRLDQVLPSVDFEPRLQAVLERALQRSPEDRYEGAAEFGRALLEAAGRMPNAPQRGEVRLSATGIIPAQAPVGRRMPEGVPETRVSEAKLEGTIASPAVAKDHSQQRPPRAGKTATFAAAAGMVLIVGLGLGLLVLQRGERPEGLAVEHPPTLPPSSDPMPAAATAVTPLDVVPPGPAPVPSAERRDTGRPETVSPPVATPPQEFAEPAERPPPARAAGDDGAADPAPPEVSAEIARAAILRQFRSMVPGLSAREYAARRDTASAFWQRDDLDNDVRARAAWVVAASWREQGDDAQCRTWAQRALSLHESAGSRTLYQQCGGD